MKSQILATTMAALLVMGGVGAAFANETVGSGLPEGAVPYNIVDNVSLEQHIVSGTIIEVYEDGDILIHDANLNQDVYVHINDDTNYIGNSESDLTVGSDVKVFYNGIATMSLPMQINAIAVQSEVAVMPIDVQQHLVSGVILEVYEDGDLLIYDADINQNVYVHINDDTKYLDKTTSNLTAGTEVTVFYNGIATKSLPMQINALAVQENNQQADINALDHIFVGQVITVGEDHILLENPVTQEQAIVHLSDQTTYPQGISEDMAVGNYVIAEYNGIIMPSLPMQLSATSIVYNSSAIPQVDALYVKSAAQTIASYYHDNDVYSYTTTVTDEGTYKLIKFYDDNGLAYVAKVNPDTLDTYYIENHKNLATIMIYMSEDQAIEAANKYLESTPLGEEEFTLVQSTPITQGTDGYVSSYVLTYQYENNEGIQTAFVQISPNGGTLISFSGDL